MLPFYVGSSKRDCVNNLGNCINQSGMTSNYGAVMKGKSPDTPSLCNSGSELQSQAFMSLFLTSLHPLTHVRSTLSTKILYIFFILKRIFGYVNEKFYYE